MTLGLTILKQDYFNGYKVQLKVDAETAFATLKNRPQSVNDFKFYLANSAVHSSNIEGNTISFDTYLKSSEFNLHLKTREIKEIEDLIDSFHFSRKYIRTNYFFGNSKC